ncbi:hypothetical protein DEVEQU_03442 [Devosia equisanguinis]|uniref:Uncharacterized protein n=1 Tax=Devosia equisanguinis TaxID=2490941 RepID=A0A3S5D3M9_9HYPH|nr:DUF6447 family protein [Devosia equisanguinis]VDS06285.1 hypothetical protein DEVEQU_03442 [Devosia equisanguinis]
MTETITIDGRSYALADLPAAAREQINNVQVTDQEIARLQMRLAIAQTARAAYARALQDSMAQATPTQGDVTN